MTIADLPPNPHQALWRAGLDGYLDRFTLADTLYEALEHATAQQGQVGVDASTRFPLQRTINRVFYVARIAHGPEEAPMKWIILIVITVIVVVWLSRGRAIKRVADPEMKTVEKKNFYVQPTEEETRDDNKP